MKRLIFWILILVAISCAVWAAIVSELNWLFIGSGLLATILALRAFFLRGFKRGQESPAPVQIEIKFTGDKSGGP